MTTLATLVVRLVGDTTGLSKSLNETNGLVENSTGRLGALGGVLKGGLVAGVGAAVVGVGALAAGLYDAVGEAMAAEEVSAQLAAVLASTGGVAGVTADMATGLADSLSKVTRFEDDAILSGENMLLTFTNIGDDIFPAATEAMLNMSQTIGQDLNSSAVQLGKALNDPIQGVTALTRVGVSFTDAQKEQIKALQESGDLMGAQQIILGELQREFGGAAVAAGQTFAGQLDIMKNSLGNVKEEVGMALLPALQTLAQTLGPMLLSAAQGLAQFIITNVVPALRDIFTWVATNLPPALQKLAQFWTGTLQPALATVWAFIQNNVVPVLRTVFQWLAENIPPALQKLAQFWTGTLQPALATVWGFIQGSVIPILQQVFVWLATNIPPALQTLANFWNTVLLPAIEDVWEFISVNLVPLFETLVNVTIAALKLALEGLELTWNLLKAALTKIWEFVRDNVIPIFVEIAATLDGPVTIALNALKGLLEGAVQTALGIFRGAVDGVAGAIRGITDAINTVIGWIDRLREKLSGLELPGWLTPGSPTPFEYGLIGISDAMRALSSAHIPAFGRGLGSLGDALDQLIETIGTTTPEMIQQLADALGNVMQAIQTTLDAFVDLAAFVGVDNLVAQLDLLGAHIQILVRKFLELAEYFAAPGSGIWSAKAVLDPLAEIFTNLQDVVAGFQALALLNELELNVEAALTMLRDVLPRLVFGLAQAAATLDMTGLPAAVKLAQAAGAIGQAMGDAVTGILAAIEFRTGRMADGTDLFIATLQAFIGKLAAASGLMNSAGYGNATAFAQAAGEIGRNVQDAITGILAAATFRLDRLADGTALFATQMQQFVLALVEAARLFDNDGLKLATAFAQAAGEIGRNVQDAITGITLAAKYAGLALVQGARLFAADAATLVRELGAVAVQFETAALSAASDFAAAAGAIGENIESAIAGMRQAMDYAGGLAATAVTRLANDLLTMVDGLVQASGAFDGDALAAAQALAEAAGAIGGSISSAVEGLQAIMAYTGGLTTAAVQRFVADMQIMVSELSFAAGLFSESALAAAVRLATAAQTVGEGIQSMADAMAALVEYTAPSPEKLDEFAADVYSMIDKLRAVAMVLGDDAIEQALAFAEAGARIYQAIEDGIDSVLGITGSGSMTGVGVALQEMVDQVVEASGAMMAEFDGMIDAAFDFGAGWVDAIMDGLESRLGDLEDLMAYIRGLFPSSPAEHGAWRELPDGAAVGEAFTAAMAGAVSSGAASVAGALAGLRSAFGMDGEGGGAAGPGGQGGLHVTVYVQGGEPAVVRQAAELGVMEAARALGWA